MCMYKGPVLWDTTVCTLRVSMYSGVMSRGLMSCSMDNQKMHVQKTHSVRLKMCDHHY